MSLQDTVLEIADEMANAMFDEYMNGNNAPSRPDLTWIVFALKLQYPEASKQIIEMMLNDYITECYNDMMEG